MLTFGSYFCFDMPSVLQQKFIGISNCTGNETDPGFDSNSSGNSCVKCDDCLGMTEDNYNLLYAIYAWTNAVVVIGACFFIVKLGNRVGVFLFSFLCVVGSSTFAVGAMLKGSSAMLPVLLLGRLIFGSGNGSLTIVRNFITAYWFRNKELAMSFGITLAFSRFGSVLNFFFTSSFADAHGLNWTLWGASMWPSIPLVVKQNMIGTAMGLTTSLQMIGIGISNLAVGQILGKNQHLTRNETLLRWKFVMIFLLANSLLCVTTTIFLNLVDKKGEMYSSQVDSQFRLHGWVLLFYTATGYFSVNQNLLLELKKFDNFYWKANFGNRSIVIANSAIAK